MVSKKLPIETTRDSFLTQHILTPTRGRTTNDPSLLDLFFTSNEENIESIEMHAPLGKPDHSMIRVLYRSQPENLPERKVCNYAKADFVKMKEKLDIDWGTYLNECADDIDTVWQKFINKFEQADRKCIPIKIVKTGKRKFSYPLDRKALAKRKKKYRLWKRFMDTKDAKVYEEYCRCRNHVRRLTRKAIKSQEKDIAKKTKTNSKVFWKFVKRSKLDQQFQNYTLPANPIQTK